MCGKERQKRVIAQVLNLLKCGVAGWLDFIYLLLSHSRVCIPSSIPSHVVRTCVCTTYVCTYLRMAMYGLCNM